MKLGASSVPARALRTAYGVLAEHWAMVVVCMSFSGVEIVAYTSDI